MSRDGTSRVPTISRRALIAVPLLLFALDGASRLVRGETTEYLLVPPLAVITYRLFSNPEDTDSRLRAVVLIPVLAAVAGEVGYALLGATPWGVAAVLLVVLVCERLARASMPPALAIAVLAMFLGVAGPWYPLDVLFGTAFLWFVFRGWRLLTTR